MVQKFLTVTVGLVAVLALSACEHDLTWKGEKPPRVVDAKTGQPENQPQSGLASAPTGIDRLNAAPGLQPPAKFPPPNERDLMVMTDKLGGSVEIYDLNSDVPRAYGGGTASASGGMPSSVDSSVMVFPVDGAYPGQAQASWPNSILPTNSMTASPGMGGGKASPHAGSGYAPSQIFFKHGSSRLGSGDRRVLNEVADKAKFAPVDRISVEGFASRPTGVSDPIESKIVNLKQSMNRAFTVSSQLMRDGVPAEKIKTSVWGDTKSTGSEAQDRRVDIVTGAQ